MTDDKAPLKLVELVPIELLERLKDLFQATLGVPIVFTDADGEAVTTVEEPLRFCGTLVRCGSGTVCLRRRKWDVPEPEVEEALKAERKLGRPVQHRCSGGFRDAASPIVVGEETVGYAVFARSLMRPPDVEKFRTLAAGAGMDPEVGERVAASALVMSQEKIAQIAEFLRMMTGLVARAAHDTIRAARVMELETLRDDMMHMIVHDLRTPLTGVMTSLQTVEVAEYDPELTREFVPTAIASARTLLELINTLLDVGKMESGEMELELAPVRFAEVAEEAVSQVTPLAEDRSQELVTDIAADCPDVQADEEKLRRTVVNLLGNAIKFTPVGGAITLSARRDGDGLTFSVSDTGPGIPPEYLEKVFDKFGQVEARKSGPDHSTGLGLTFCKMVAEAHGGRIWVDSEVGKGSTFSVCIPNGPRGPG